MEISLCMIVKNEEDVLDRCLSCASKFADEIVIVDTGSTDKTKEIASKYDAKIYDFQWCSDFGKARNFAFEHGTKDYLMWLDADDYITDENIDKILELKKNISPSVDAISMHYSLGRDENGNTITSLRRNRIVKRKQNFQWIGRIHEYISVYGNVVNSDVYIFHDKHKAHTNRNLLIFRKMQEDNVEFTSRDTFYFANELYYNSLYEESITEYNKFLKEDGWIEDRKTAIANLANCYEALNQPENMISTILESFKWCKPRADICYKLANYFFNKESYNDAILWYKICMMCTPEKDNMGLDYKDYYTWIPAIQLCVCYSRIGDFYSSYYYNELCGVMGGIKAKVEYNRKYLNEELSKRGISIPQFNLSIIDSNLR